MLQEAKMSDYKIVDVFEQAATFDGVYTPAVDASLLMSIVNHMGTHDDDEIAEMENPKRLAVRITIATKELQGVQHEQHRKAF